MQKSKHSKNKIFIACVIVNNKFKDSNTQLKNYIEIFIIYFLEIVMKPNLMIEDELSALSIANTMTNASSYVEESKIIAAMRIIRDEAKSQYSLFTSYPWKIYPVSDDILLLLNFNMKYYLKVYHLARNFIDSTGILHMRNTEPMVEWEEVRDRLYKLNLKCNLGQLTNQEIEIIYWRLRHDTAAFCY